MQALKIPGLKRRVLPHPPGIPHLNLNSLAALGSPGLRGDSAFTSTSRTLTCWFPQVSGAQVGGEVRKQSLGRTAYIFTGES